jgi:hypothetical protein
MAKSKFFRIAVEGATTDGRTIERDWIVQMAATYKPDTYTARVNCEHLRGFSPDAPFNAYGSVLSLKAEEVDLDVGGKTEKRMGLFAQIDANDQLVAINRKGQKIFTSCEIDPAFANTRQAYLVGLAVTDSPASLGTEALSFAALKPMFDARKQNKDNLFTAAELADFAIEAGEENAGLIGAMTKLFDSFAAKFKVDGGDGKTPVTPPAPPPVNDNAFDPAAFAAELGKTVGAAMSTFATAQDAKIDRLGGELAALTNRLATTEQPGHHRQQATGGDGTILTDC